jgi:hypothetical protein
MSDEKTPGASPAQPTGAITLDAALIALQKTFSRVSQESAKVPDDHARALISGKVAFHLSLKVGLDPQKSDQFLIQSGGGIELKLDGTIEPDVRVIERVHDETSTAAA